MKKQYGLFKKGAWLYAMDRELSEKEFIDLASSGSRGFDYLMGFKNYPFVSLVLDDPNEPLLVGHLNGKIISIVMSNHDRWQTMEWKK